MIDFCSLLLPREDGVFKSLIEIELDDGAIVQCSPGQGFLTLNERVFEARELCPGMRLLGVGSPTNEKEYVVKKTAIIDCATQLMSLSSVRYRNFALGCGIFVRP